MRLSAIYALLDCKGIIDTPHMLAALALWQYAIESVFFIFGNKTGDSVADSIYEALKQRGEMTDTEISAMFNRNQSARRLAQAKSLLKEAGKIRSETRETEGRKLTVWRLSKYELNELDEKSPYPLTLNSLNSSISYSSKYKKR